VGGEASSKTINYVLPLPCHVNPLFDEKCEKRETARIKALAISPSDKVAAHDYLPFKAEEDDSFALNGFCRPGFSSAAITENNLR
jgi:hypothetical protein